MLVGWQYCDVNGALDVSCSSSSESSDQLSSCVSSISNRKAVLGLDRLPPASLHHWVQTIETHKGRRRANVVSSSEKGQDSEQVHVRTRHIVLTV